MVGPRNISRPACACSHAQRRPDHGAKDFRVLAHAEVIIRAPDHYLARTFLRMPDGVRVAASYALEFNEHPITTFAAEPSQRVREVAILRQLQGSNFQ